MDNKQICVCAGSQTTQAQHLISRLIKPLPVSEFFDKYWEQRPCHIQGSDERAFSGLLTLEDIDEVISGVKLRPSELRLTQFNHDIDERDYLVEVNSHGNRELEIDPDKVYWLYSQGATIILNALNRYLLPLAEYTRGVERAFQSHCQANVYVTPPTAQGFAAHWDTHDVFILQVFGEKRWIVRGAPVSLPLRNQVHDPSRAYKTDVIMDVALASGDTLYIPRGYIHEAATNSCASAHITLGVHAFTWADLLQQIVLEAASNDDVFRSAVFSPLRQDESLYCASVMQELVGRLLRSNYCETCLRNEQLRFVDTRRPIIRNQFRQLASLETLSAETEVAVRETVLYSLTREDDICVLRFHGKTMNFPADVYGPLQHIFQRASLRISEIPDLDSNGSLTLVKRLVKEGILALLDPASEVDEVLGKVVGASGQSAGVSQKTDVLRP